MESWKHRVIRESLERGWTFIKISKTFGLSISAIVREVENDMNLKIYIL